jgi:hypothetical protein
MNKSFLKRKNNMRRIFSVGFLLLCFFANAGDIKYPVSSIPENLKKNANVVKRMEEYEFRIINTGEAVLRHKYALTVLNENGDDNAVLVEYYDQLEKINSIEGALYDASGNQLKKMKTKDATDLSAVDDNNLMDGNRKKVHRFFYKSYPYTIEYEVETKFNYTLFFPTWLPQEDEHFAVEQSSYTIISPSNYTIRYRAFNYPGEPLVTEGKGQKIMKWELKNIVSVVRPFAAPPFRELTTMVYFAPTDFEIQGYKGNMSSWLELGKFQFTLNMNRDQLPEKTIQTVRDLTSGIIDDKQKVRVLYNFLQKNTRYISIQLGVGGWQPFEASFVAEKGYGDCKALTNYMYSLLKAAGIKANYTLIYAGEGAGNNFIEDFPSRQFNHAILCVPLAKDTMWLECTSQDTPPGYMGEFTGNRKALMITENGGVIVSTPHYGLKENLLTRTISAKVETDGTLNMKVRTKYGGTQQDDLSMMVNSLSKDKLEKILQEEFQLSTYNVNDFKYEETKSIIPEIDEDLDITVNGYATTSGKRLFVIPNILNRANRKIDVDEDRKVDFVFNSEWKDEDNYEIEIPQGYTLEAMPRDVSLKTKFGSYSCTTKLSANKIIYHRVREQFGGRFPAKDQQELAKFFEDIYKGDRARMVLVKKSE